MRIVRVVRVAAVGQDDRLLEPLAHERGAGVQELLQGLAIQSAVDPQLLQGMRHQRPYPSVALAELQLTLEPQLTLDAAHTCVEEGGGSRSRRADLKMVAERKIAWLFKHMKR